MVHKPKDSRRHQGYAFFVGFSLAAAVLVSLAYAYSYPPPMLNYVDFHSDNFTKGNMINVTIYGSGAVMNLTLKRNTSMGYPNATGNFTSQVFDAGRISNWTYISWNQEIPYQKEIGRTNRDSRVTTGMGFLNTSGLVALYHLNNETTENNSLIKDYSLDLDNGRAGYNNLSCMDNQSVCPSYDIQNTKFGSKSMKFNGTSTYLLAKNSSSIGVSREVAISVWLQFPSAFTRNVSDNDFGLLDKGDYQLLFDRQSGQLRFEVAPVSNNTWAISYNGAQEYIYSLAVYNGKLYAAQGTDAGDGDVLVFDGSSWSTSYDGSQEIIYSLGVYNDKLYAGQGIDTGDGDVLVFDGTSWGTSYDGAQDSIRALTAYNGRLYAAQGHDSGDGDVLIFDGTSWSTSYDGSTDFIQSLASYKNRLYAGLGSSVAGTGDVVVFDGSSWSTSYNGAQEVIFSLGTYDGRLYAGQGLGAGDGDILVFDGNSWSTSYDGSQERVQAFAVYNGKLYAGQGVDAGDGDALVFDGNSWSTAYNGSQERVQSLAVYNGRLYAGQGLEAGDGDVLVFGNHTIAATNKSFWNAGKWHHVAATFNGTHMGLYVDGLLENMTQVQPSAIQSNKSNLYIGSMAGSSGAGLTQAHFNGSLDEIAIFNRSLSVDEIRNIYKRGALALNISTRTSQDNITWTSWSAPYQNESNSTINGTTEARFLQYKASFSTENGNFTPILFNATAFYILSQPTLTTTYTLPTYPRKDQNVTLVANISGDRISSVNFTLISPSGTKVVAGRNGSTNGDGNWNFSSYNLTAYGTWLWNVTAFDSDGFIVNSTTQSIILMELGASLNASIASPNTSVFVFGHINLSNNTNVSNTRYFVYLNDSKLNDTGNFTDTSDTDFNSGIKLNLTVYGSGSVANLTLFRNSSNGYPNATGNFTRTIDAGSTTTWASLSWNQEIPYQKEIGRANGDGNNANKQTNYVNTTGLVALYHFNNESGENDTRVKDFSPEINVERAAETHNNLTWQNGGTSNATPKLGDHSGFFDSVNDFLNASDGKSLDVPRDITVVAWVYPVGVSGVDPNSFIVNKWGDQDSYMLMRSSSGKARFYVDDDGVESSEKFSESISTVPYDTWTFLASTFNGSETRIYVNGVLENTTTYGSVTTLFNSADPLRIGTVNPTPVGLWNGSMDEIAIWNRSLSADEIKNVYKRGALRLNVSTRTSNDDVVYSGWSSVYSNETYSTISQNNSGRYLQYKISMSTENGNFTPVLNDITINYTGLFTDSSGNYNYTFTAPASEATYSIKVNTTYSNTIPGERLTTFQVTSGGLSIIHLDGGLIDIRNASDGRLAIIDSLGNVNIKGTLTQNAQPFADSNDWVIQNSSGGLNVVITNPEGNLLLKNSLSQNQNTLSPTLSSIVVENRSKQVVAYFNSTGGMFITGSLYESRTFD